MSERNLHWGLFVFFLLFYALFLGDYSKESFYSSDEIFYFRLTQSLVERRSLAIEPYLGYECSKYMPGQSLAGVPAYLAALAVGRIFPPADSPISTLLIVHLTNIFIGAWLCLVFFKFGRELGYSKNASIGGALILGLGTTLFPYSRQFFADPLTGLAILCGVRFLWKAAKGENGAAILGGLCFGAAAFTKIDSVFLLLPVIIWFLLNCSKKAGGFIAGLIPFGALILLYNYLNYGSAITPGYERQAFASPFLSGLFGLLISPSRGLFIYSPPVILFFMGMASFRKKYPALFSLCVGLILVKTAILAKWFSWQGGWCWGARLFLPVMPLMMLPAIDVLENWQGFSRNTRFAATALIGAGLLVQLAGSMASPNKFNNDIWGMMHGNMNEFLFIPQLATIKGNLFLISQGQWDLAWVAALRNGGVAVKFLFIVHLAASLFFGGLLLREMGMGKKGWASALMADARAFAVPIICVPLIFITSHLIMLGQGLDTLRWMFIEDDISSTRGETRRFEGYLYAPVTGEYHFHLKALGKYRILLDGTPLLVSEKEMPQHWDYAAPELAKGFHAISGVYQPKKDAGKALMHLYWTIPDGAIYKSIISPQYLFKRQPNTARRLAMLFVQFRSWLIFAALALPFLKKRRVSEFSLQPVPDKDFPCCG
ncbi:MAG TPA: PA14 domain-containing protein [Candidatus Sumerlaeota bacterium]|nr:MAG: PA14 domain protein [candidate division BRC1 bacterium ADurb.Bin183]HOE62975.1 PA14 domain-containing protein [Candidatus Sumerlaeota bacterium]HRR30198.1 PA14 domain-containing protein [Candidatus Sumerlaeia bacterium]HON49596.1 PA14 domain-containing protein [Candidatus Sumerlaeota bacterium]HOR64748.1 PA14 domain-containing protein [Candidatus Sumerlaeota bacterium]